MKNALRDVNGNIDKNEKMQVLTTYKQCMLKSFKENVKAAADMRAHLKDKLLKSLIFSSDSHRESEENLDIVQSNACYNLCGYLVHTRELQIKCSSCLSSLLSTENELPNDFYAAYITSLKTKGYLRFASLPMFQLFSKIEKELQSHFKKEVGYLRDSFETIIR